MKPLFFLLGWFLCGVCAFAGDGLDGKVWCGYQGWFRVPADGADNGWHHYAGKQGLAPGSASVELWPDVRELPAADRFPTGFKFADGSVAEVFSSVNKATVDMHFRWMREYGIDGVFLQRFAVSARDDRFRKPMDTVLELCRSAAAANGRQWVLMYDLSGIKPGEIGAVIEDWKRLDAKFHLRDKTANAAYVRLRGKPLVALWGLGFSDRAPMLDEWRQLIEFLKNDPQYGDCSLMLGVPAYFRTLERDSLKDATFHELLKMADVISPWTVGRFNSPAAAASHALKTMGPDIAWCTERGLDYLPVNFPGFSWQNLQAGRGKTAALNAIPRLGGQFLWSQFYAARKAGAKAFYVAMFDEMDEGTAIFKVRQDPPTGVTTFLSEPEVPGDEYLWVAGEAGRRLLKTEALPTTDALPARKH